MLGRIMATQEIILDKLETNDEKTEKMENRLTYLETKINRAAGAITVLLALISTSGAFLISWLKTKA